MCIYTVICFHTSTRKLIDMKHLLSFEHWPRRSTAPLTSSTFVPPTLNQKVKFSLRLHTTASSTVASHNMIDRISQKNHIFCPEACARSKCEQPITGHSKLVEFNVTTLVFCRVITSKQWTSQRKKLQFIASDFRLFKTTKVIN